MVVDADDADRVPLLGDRLRHRAGDAALHGADLAHGRAASTCACVDTIAQYLFYAFIIDFSLEMIDLIHRIYEADESFRALDFMVHTRLFMSQIVLQILVGHGACRSRCSRSPRSAVAGAARARLGLYIVAGVLTLIGIFAMRWNVVIGGQLFSKSFLGYTTYKMEFATREGLLPAIALMIAPFGILWALVHLLPPWVDEPRTWRR